jgi:uncharacterized phage protein (TIGR01671 family)
MNNNHRLKFRVWDKLTKSFIFPDKGYQGHFVITLNGKFQNLQNGSGGDECVVQQYTGFTDMNDKEIYEGDILYLEDNEEYFQVYWSGDGWIKLSSSSKQEYTMDDYSDAMYIVGNIFETPKLLK